MNTNLKQPKYKNITHRRTTQTRNNTNKNNSNTTTGAQTQNFGNFISSGNEGSGKGRFSCPYHFGLFVIEDDFGVASIWWLLAKRRENLMEVGDRVRHESNRDEWFKGMRKKEEKFTMKEKLRWKEDNPHIN